jgi:manganese transport protein
MLSPVKALAGDSPPESAVQRAAAHDRGWRRPSGTPSLSEVFGSIRTRPTGTLWRKLLAFLGPGYLVAVGYMDPGNWATSLAGGSKFGYALLTIALLSNLMAILLQALCIRLGIASKRDLAQACRDAFPRFVSYPLWLVAELAICATDLAEVIGTAIGLNLLFGIPLEIGVLLTAADVFLILWMQQLGFRYVEALVARCWWSSPSASAFRSPWPTPIGARSSAGSRRPSKSSRIRRCSISRSAFSAPR